MVMEVDLVGLGLVTELVVVVVVVVLVLGMGQVQDQVGVLELGKELAVVTRPEVALALVSVWELAVEQLSLA